MKDNFDHNKQYMDYLHSIPKEVYIKILENCFSDIYVTDKDRKILYANPNSLRHYGVPPEEMVGKDSESFRKGKWTPSALDLCMREKRTVFVEQNYLMIGKNISSVLTPIFDEDGEIEMVVAIASEPPVNYDLTWRKVDGQISSKSGIDHDGSEDKKDDIIAQSYVFCKILNTIKKVAKSDVSILLTGESGVGKTLVAEYIHKISLREDNPFWAINCAAIPENLLESELFGYAPHAFTGASNKGKIGLIELADGGTLFLDEIGDLAPSLQAKLLDVLENKRFIPVGGNEMKHVDIRIVAATNSDLGKLVADKKFRSDLYWRLNTINIEIPSLRERKEDILPLTSYFLKKFNEKYKKDIEFSPKAIAVFLSYDWPGNIRQLKNMVERSVLLAIGGSVTAKDLPEFIIESVAMAEDNSNESYDRILDSIGKHLIRESYKKHRNMKKVAKELGMTHSKAFRLVNEYCQDIK
ncbi:sigma-54 interaction domain-containing protein [Alkalibacter mobilis]|uniref:sigma-54 interaction domain-containing protein n=1 Tax=Alkalibacter mobilis TaxID=2787712 RepID=UPI00189ED025|nr:sigma 54-interacting transcriptional regulator [Alkalibacter mobilis]MBF7096822.1 sigma 54-interacting transcriptional regulator [Alkalibacter mobilis]